MVHVRVRHKDIGEAQDLARREPADVPEIEQERAFLEQAIHVDPGIADRVVHQHGMKKRLHALWKL